MLKKRKVIVRESEAIINTKTGEVVGMVGVQTINTPTINAGFRISYNPGLEGLLSDPYQSAPSKVFSYILKRMNEDNILLSSNNKIATEMNVSHQFISQCISQLKSKNRIKKKINAIMVNPIIVFSGNKFKFDKLVEIWDTFNN